MRAAPASSGYRYEYLLSSFDTQMLSAAGECRPGEVPESYR